MRLILVNLSFNQRLDLFERALGIGAFATNLQFRSLSCREHHQTHDALAIYFFALLFHPNLGPKTARHLNQKRRWPRMQTEPAHNRDFLFGVLRGGASSGFSA